VHRTDQHFFLQIYPYIINHHHSVAELAWFTGNNETPLIK